jgi:hypothetical protein
MLYSVVDRRENQPYIVLGDSNTKRTFVPALGVEIDRDDSRRFAAILKFLSIIIQGAIKSPGALEQYAVVLGTSADCVACCAEYGH